jgi:transmembrane sensor
MENQRLDELIEKYILKTASIEEQQELLDWYCAQNDSEVMWSSDQLNEEVLVKRRLLANINERIQPKAKSISLWPRIAVAAATVALIVLGVYFFIAPRHPEFISGSPLANDIKPGKNRATLTLANGKTIMLSDAKTGVVVGNELKYNDNTAVMSVNGRHPEFISGSQNRKGGDPGLRRDDVVMSTPRGGTYQVILPDGSKVWLNAAFLPASVNCRHEKLN